LGHGAIIAIQQDIGLDEYAETGSFVDARVSADILTTIFTPHSPLHDGAVLISGNQIHSAGAILPLTQSQVDHSLGTRHRAAIGLSEETDAIVIIVSEETAQIAVAIEGHLEQDLSADRLREVLLGRLPTLDTALQPVELQA
jgi:diadenylate cyclase